MAARPDIAPGLLDPLDEAAERRQLSILFCDLVNSSALVERFDPEDAHDILRAYQQVCASVAVRHGGFVAQFLGDGVLIYFGYPHAAEDAAHCAVRAGLDMVGEVAALRTVAGALRARVGIATGITVIREGADAAHPERAAITGQAVVLASRIQAAIEPGAVGIAESTHRLIGTQFQCEPAGVERLKGIEAAVRLWRVFGEVKGASRFEARRDRHAVEMVGRADELATLLALWDRAAGGDA